MQNSSKLAQSLPAKSFMQTLKFSFMQILKLHRVGRCEEACQLSHRAKFRYHVEALQPGPGAVVFFLKWISTHSAVRLKFLALCHRVVTIHPVTWPHHRTVTVCFHRLRGWRDTPSTFILCWHPRISALCVQLCCILFGIRIYSFPRKDDLLLTKWKRYWTGQRPLLLFSPTLNQVSLLTSAPSVSWTKEPGLSRRPPL